LPLPADVDAEWIYGGRTLRAGPQDLERKARREAEAIVKDAELKALEILTSAERARSHVEAELTREQARMAEKSRRLSRLLADALDEVERASANGSTTGIPDLRELRALRDELRSSE
jgi:vacuolar-type H+-ATPase subunit H